MTDLEILDAIRGGTTKPQNRSMMIGLLLASAAVFLLVGAKQWDLQRAVLLVVSIFIHECGHLAAMRACRYKNLKMLFIPFFGAVASGRPSEHNALKIAIIALAGPLAGLLAAGCALLAWRVAHNGVLLDFAQISIILNGFNLLPILPLDGGHLLNEVLLARFPKAELGFRIAAVLAMAVLAAKFGAGVFAWIAVVLFMGMKVTYEMGSAINRLRAVDGMMGGELTEEKVGLIRKEIEDANPVLRKIANAPKLPAQVESAWARVNKVFPRPAAAALLLGVYLSTLLVGVPFGAKTASAFKNAPVLAFNNDGLQRLKKRDFKGAVAAFDKALELQANDPVVHMNRGCARFGVGDYGGAILDLTLGLAKNPDVQVGYYLRALSYEEGADFQLEINDCKASLRLKPNDPEMLAHLGYAESRLGDLGAALSDCDRAVALSPRKSDILWQRAYVNDIAGDFAGAARDYAGAVNASFASDMGRIRWAIDLRRQKLSDTQTELRGRAPFFQDSWIRSIGLYLTGALPEEQLVARAEANAPDLKSRYLGQAYYYIGISHLLGGDSDGAHSFLDRSRNVGLPFMGETGLAQAELGRLGEVNGR